jgi:hypothetical protein
MVAEVILLPIFCGEIMPRVITSFLRGQYWFYYATYGGKVREIYVPQQDQNRTIEILLPRPISVDEIETWVRRNNGRFLYEAALEYMRADKRETYLRYV